MQIRFLNRSMRCLTVAGALLLAACSDDPAGTSGATAGKAAGGIPLAFAPADTPYVIGNLEPAPEAVRESWWANSESVLAMYMPFMQKTLAQAKPEERAKHPLGFAIADELFQLDTRAEIEALGLDGRQRAAIYGVGLLPVLRMELADPGPLKALLGRAEAKSGQKIPLINVGGMEYYQGEAGPFQFVLGFPSGQLLVTMLPKSAPEAVKQTILASAPPAQNAIGKITELNSKYSFPPVGSGYIDTQRVLDTVLAPTGDVDRELFKALDVETPELSAACRSDFARIAAQAPRMVFGMQQMEARKMVSLSILELDAAIAGELATLAEPIPDLAAQAKWLGIGFGVNAKALPAFLEGRAEALAANPFQCEDLAGMQADLADAAQKLKGATIYLGMAKGFAVAIDALDIDFASKQPRKLEATLLIASDNPATLVGMAAAGAPQIAALGLEPNGEAKALPLDGVPPNIAAMGTAYAVMTDTALVARFGPDDQGAGAKAAATLPLTGAGHLLTYNISGEFYRLFGAAMDMNPAAPEEMRDSMKKMFDKYADVFGSINTEVLLTARGVEMRQTINMK